MELESFIANIDSVHQSCRQVEQLKSQVAQLNARCQEQQQDLDFLKVISNMHSKNFAK